MGRPKGFIVSEEQKKAMQEGRRKARETKISAGIPLRQSKKTKKEKTSEEAPSGSKPVVLITGKEEDAFGFYAPLRDALRPLNLYPLLDKLIKKITERDSWKNVGMIQNTLSYYVELRLI
jgi:hypothetical protein